MFVGSINSKIRNLIFAEKELFRERNICIGCSGNFTVEQILQGLGCKIWSNDIALYSSLIVNHLAGKPMRLKISDPAYGWLSSLQEAMEDGAEEAVVFALGGARKRIRKETAKSLRKRLKEKSDAGQDLDAALLSLIE